MTAALDFEPLEARLDALFTDTAQAVSHVMPVAQRQAYYRARRARRLTPEAADELCVRVLGCHPVAVFGAAWWNA